MNTPLHVLIIEDSEDDAALLVNALQRGRYDPIWRRIDSAEKLMTALDEQEWDVILADCILPHFSGLAAAKILRQKNLDIPFIMLSGRVGEDVTSEAMKAGAQDYVTKWDLSRLVPAIQRELGEKNPMNVNVGSVFSKALGMNLSLKASIYVAGLVTLLTLGGYLAYTVHEEQVLADVAREMLDTPLLTMRSANQIKVSLVAHDDALFRYLATRNSDQREECMRLRSDTQRDIRRLLSLSRSQVVRSRLDLLLSESDNYFREADYVIDFAQKNSLPEHAGLFTAASWAMNQGTKRQELDLLSAAGQTRLVRVFSLCDELITLYRVDLETAQTEIKERFAQSRRAAWKAGVGAGIVVFLVSLRLALSLLIPLQALLIGIRRVQQGDLDLEIPLTSLDEIGEITTVFNLMTRTVRQQQKQLLQETITDGLTGIYNQRHFRELLKQESDRSRRSGRPLCLLMIDVDHFKKYNDRQGHEAGNDLLKRVCQLIRENLRDSDAFARYGGDEFSVIFPDTSPADAQVIAHKLQGVIFSCHLAGTEALPAGRLTLSIGGASTPVDARSGNELVLKADEALYAAKQAGRACVRWASPPFIQQGLPKESSQEAA